ncbi:MAG: hypothetical protein WAX77_15590 [Methylococcaceae bacterium]
MAKNPNDLQTILDFGKLLRFDTNDKQAANALYENACQLFPYNIELLSAYCNSLTNSRYGDEYEHFAKAYQIALKLLTNDSALLLPADDL